MGIAQKITRLYDWIPRTSIKSTEVDAEFNQVVAQTSALVDDIFAIELSKADANNVYTKAEIDAVLLGGDTIINAEVYTMGTINVGDGTCTYTINGVLTTGPLTVGGYPIFTLTAGEYGMGDNKISAIINDTLHRSKASGGLEEITPTTFAILEALAESTEITVTYFQSVGLVNGGFVTIGTDTPVTNSVWFKVLE